MAKATAGRSTPAKGKAAAPPPKEAKTAAVDAKKKAVGKTLATKAAAPKMAPAAKKGAAVKARPATPKAATKAAPARKAPSAPSKSSAPAPRKATPLKGPSRKTTGPARPAARTKPAEVKKAAPRRQAVRTAVPTPAPRRVSRPATAPRPPAPGLKSAVAPQVFTVSHLNEDDFKLDGLRTYAKYRDLGIAAATGGLCQAHVIRFVPPCTDEVRKRHMHNAELQLVYVLNGWIKNEFDGHGEQMMSTGSCWLQPTGIKHTVLDYSPDCEVLEIIVPADFKTEDLT